MDQKVREVRKESWIWLGGAVDNSYDEASWTRQLEGEMFKRREGWDGDGSCLDGVPVDNSNAAPPPLWAGFVNVSVSRGGGLIENDEFKGFLPSFSDAEEIQFIVHDKVIQNMALVAEGAGVE